MNEETLLISKQTMNWVQSFVIGLNICPFAKGPVNKKALRISVSECKKKELALEDLMTEVRFLDDNPAVETTLLVFANTFKDFFAYLDYVDLAEQLMHMHNYEGIYQLATFHPDYFFADCTAEDVANYTNRSPYPMIHLLREEQLEKAIAAYGNTEEIPEKNIATMHALGLEKIKMLIDTL